MSTPKKLDPIIQLRVERFQLLAKIDEYTVLIQKLNRGIKKMDRVIAKLRAERAKRPS